MNLTFIILWIIVIFLICLDVVFFFPFLHISSQRTTKALLGLLSNCLITLVALIALIYLQVHNVNAFKAGSSSLFLCALFVEQVIVQWTVNDQAQSRTPTLRRVRVFMTVFVILYTLLALVGAFFHF